MEINNSKILLIGAGNMGGALLRGWIKAGFTSLTVVEPSAALAVQGAEVKHTLKEVSGAFDIIMIAVKPQSLDAVIPELAKQFGDRPLYLSIAAGKTLSYFGKQLPNAAIVRAMPNTPAQIGKGISVLCANKKISDAQKTLATTLMQAGGKVEWLDDESLMDAVTAISGSGPAYAFLFMEILAKLGVEQGLSEALAKKLSLETVHGASELARRSDESLEQLRKNVTSPGGTTEAALSVLMKNDAFKAILSDAVDAAIKRSKELG